MKAIDLFCGAGGASVGLARAGFEVWGVDNRPQPRYPFRSRFVQADALNPPFDLRDFDFIWASPPCQAFSIATYPLRSVGKVYPDLVDPTRALLAGSGRPTCIENVPGAPIRPDLVLDGTMFPGLRVIRRRHFELSFPAPFALGFNAKGYVIHNGWSSVQGHGESSRIRAARRKNGQPTADTVEHRRRAMGIDWMNREEMSEAIPPAYSEFIGRAAMIILSRAAA